MKIIKVLESNEQHFLKEVSIEKDKIEQNDFLNTLLIVDPNIQYQTIEGFGASFTESSAFLIGEVLEKHNREIVMKDLFTKDGSNISFIRNTIGACDYSLDIYSYQDTPNTKFNLSRDERNVIPLTLEALKLNENLSVMASPWSAPGWMKSTNSMIGGELCKEHYSDYSQYLSKYIIEMKKRGIDIKYITVQNEPMFVPNHYPGMYMDVDMQMEFINNYLKSSFDLYEIETKILGYDHNWDRVEYPYKLVTNEVIDGIAWHWYGGSPSAQSFIHDLNPNLEVHFTEGSGGEWIPEFLPAFSNLMRTSIEIIRNRSRSLILWNMALDENNGPVIPGFGSSTCRGLVKINQVDKTYEYTLDYYGLTHFSRYVSKGSKVIKSQSSDNLYNVAFRNENNELIIVLYNDDQKHKNVRVIIEEKEKVLELNPFSAYTVVIEGV